MLTGQSASSVWGRGLTLVTSPKEHKRLTATQAGDGPKFPLWPRRKPVGGGAASNLRRARPCSVTGFPRGTTPALVETQSISAIKVVMSLQGPLSAMKRKTGRCGGGDGRGWPGGVRPEGGRVYPPGVSRAPGDWQVHLHVRVCRERCTAHIHTHRHGGTHAYTHRGVCIYAHVHLHRCIHTCTQRYTHPYTHRGVHICAHTYIDAHIRIHTEVCTHIDAHIHTHTDVHIHVHTSTVAHIHIHRHTHRCIYT